MLKQQKMLSDLLIYGRNFVDPFNRVHCCDRPVLLFVEFCQVISYVNLFKLGFIFQAEGPKSILKAPADTGEFLNLDQVALWLMSAENSHGSRLMLFNQQMNIWALVYYATILDVTARGFQVCNVQITKMFYSSTWSEFQRPVALAFLSTERPSVAQRLTFKHLTRDLFRTLLACNRRLFCSYAERIIEAANEIQQHKFHTYYNLQTSSTTAAATATASASTSNLNMKIAQIARQASAIFSSNASEARDQNAKQQFNIQFMDVYRIISAHPSLCECGKERREFEKFFALLDRPPSARLLPLFELAPCVSILRLCLRDKITHFTRALGHFDVPSRFQRRL